MTDKRKDIPKDGDPEDFKSFERYNEDDSDETESLANDLLYDEDEDSYELDVNSSTKEYRHPDDYVSAAKDGEDMNSDWDEANLLVGDEYDREPSSEDELEEAGMHIDSGRILKLDPIDEALAETPEDLRDDLDEEGYPKNDGEIMP